MVSVIIPNFNHSLYLKQRIDSILDQTYLDFELIILDDASTDNSREIIESYRENQKISAIHYNDQNSGSPFKQWQKGIELAKGKYIWIAESDDYCKPSFLASAMSAIGNYQSSVHFCQSDLVDENNQILESTLQWPQAIASLNWKESFFMTGSDFIKKGLQYRNVVPNASAVVFVKQDFEFHKIIKYKTAGDWLFWIKILMNSSVSFSPEVLNSFRSHGNTTRNLNTPEKMMLRYFEELAIKYRLFQYNLGEKMVLDQILNSSIDICTISDIKFFSNFCIRFNLPVSFTIRFITRKLLREPLRGKLTWLRSLVRGDRKG